MKKFLFFITLAIPLLAVGQKMKIRVHAENEALPYAYIYINGKIACSADTLGVASLDASRLVAGDTISASYIGRSNGHAIYDGKGSYEIELMSDNEIPTVVVVASKKQDKRIKALHIPKFYQETSGDFEISIHKSGRKIQGTVTTAKVYIYADNYSLEKEFTFRSDTTDASGIIDDLPYCMHLAELYSDISRNRYLNKEMRFADEGRDEEVFDVYTIVRAYDPEVNNVQVRAYVDPETGIIKKTDIVAPGKNFTRAISTTFATKGNIIYPSDIEIEVYRNYASRTPIATLYIKNISLSSQVFKKYKVRQKELYEEFRGKAKDRRRAKA